MNPWNHATLVSSDESLASPSTPNDYGHYGEYHFWEYPDLHEAYEAWTKDGLEPLVLTDYVWSGLAARVHTDTWTCHIFRESRTSRTSLWGRHHTCRSCQVPPTEYDHPYEWNETDREQRCSYHRHEI